MKNLTVLTSILIGSLMLGCIEKLETPDLNGSHSFFVKLQTNQGANLLNPKTEGSIDLSKTRLFLLENGEAKMVKYESPAAVLDYPYGVMSFEENGEYGVKFFFEYNSSQKELEGIIQWNEVLADTLNFTFNSPTQPSFIANVSQKGTVLWDAETAPENAEIVITLAH